MEIFSALLALCQGKLFVRESIGHWWIPVTKASDAELWCFLCEPEQAVEQTVEMLVIWDAHGSNSDVTVMLALILKTCFRVVIMRKSL